MLKLEHEKTVTNEINKKLGELGGRSVSGQPFFRVVWTEDQSEIRSGEFQVFSGDIFLRTEKGPRRVQKYPNIRNRWVLERLFPLTSNEANLIQDAKESYECIYIFQSGKGVPLPPLLKVAALVVFTSLNGREQASKIRIFSEIIDERIFQEEIRYFEDELENMSRDPRVSRVFYC